MASYIPSTRSEREEMLAVVGVDSYEGLYRDVPAEMLLHDGDLKIPAGLSELEVFRKLYDLAHQDPEYMHNAPHNAQIGRPDEVRAARNPILRWNP